MAKEFPEDLNPIPTPLTGSERVLADKGTATIDDVKAFARTGLPAPSAASDAATKGYVDARPGADAWSEHAATQDVALGGHKLTGLGEPTDASDAATKGYVDGAAPMKIERTFAWGRSVAEVADNGDIELAVYRTGEADPLRRVRVQQRNVGGVISLMNKNDSGFVSTLSVGTTSPSLTYDVTGGPEGGASNRGGFTFNGGRWWFVEQNGSSIPLGSNNYYTLPAGVSSIKHGIHLAKQAHDRRADLEWWSPVWTPVSNVDSVSNVECSYTRTYRAAGGSLVTLEGTITVTPEAAGGCAVEADIPLPVTGSTGVTGVASAADVASVYPAYATLIGGKVRLIFLAESTDEHVVPFRLSYRAA